MRENIKYPKQEIEREKDYCEKIVAKSIERVEKEGFEIGEGKAAKVLILKEDREICMKAIHDKDISCNNVEKEMFFINLLSAKGLRVPSPICAVATPKKDYLFMETIGSGVNIEGILMDKTGDKLKRIISNFDFKKFFDILRAEVEKMHNEKVYHRDLHAGNILIDKNGEPVIIDFGDANYLHLSSEDPYKKVDDKGRVTVYPDDNNKVNKLYKELGEYLKKQGYFNQAGVK